MNDRAEGKVGDLDPTRSEGACGLGEHFGRSGSAPGARGLREKGPIH
jgi:hypothetical protein